ncbi:MAG: AAA family ATPase [Deferrisomatales bacterium]
MTGSAHPELRAALGGDAPLLVVLAGPNGAGKSTFFELYLAQLGLPFVNADQIARALAPEAPASAAYVAAAAATAERRRRVGKGESFATETVLSDPVGEKVALLREARATGFTVILVFIGLESPELCAARVAQRVEEGGHDVPDEKIQARYPRTLSNLRAALPVVDAAYLFDNSSCDEPYRFVASYRNGKLRRKGNRTSSWAQGLPGLARRPPGRKRGPGPVSPARKSKGPT